MENMNLATRCREAISQVAALKKELATYQQRQHSLNGEYDGLKREIGVLRRQMNGRGGAGTLNTAAHANNGSNNAVIVNGGGLVGNGVATSGSSTEEKTVQPRPSSPTTDLDRIMSLQKFGGNTISNKKQQIEPSASQDNQKEAPDNNNAAVTVNSKIPITIAPNNSSASNQNDDEFDADIDMVDFFTKQSTATTAATTATTTTTTQPNNKSLHHHVRKPKSHTDDVMPEDIPGAGSLGFSPEGKKAAVGDSLLSSLDGECSRGFVCD